MDILLYYIFFILIFVIFFSHSKDKLFIKKLLSNSNKTLYILTKKINNNLNSGSKMFKFLSYTKWISFSLVYSLILMYLFVGMPINILVMMFQSGFSLKLFRHPFIAHNTNNIYNMYTYIDDITLSDYDKYVDTEFWYNFFKSENQLTPNIFGTLNNDYYDGYTPSKDINLVWESTKSNSIDYIKYTNLKNAPHKGKYFLREKVKNNQLIKLITYQVNNEYQILDKKILFLKNNKNTIFEIFNYCCYKNGEYKKDLPTYISKKLNEAIDDAILLHKKLNHKGVVEWHITFDKNDYYFVSADINPFICNHSYANFYGCFKEYLNKCI